jgi:hypothetical protein
MLAALAFVAFMCMAAAHGFGFIKVAFVCSGMQWRQRRVDCDQRVLEP